MGIFGQRRRKGHLKTASEGVQSFGSHSTDFEVRADTASSPQNDRIDAARPFKPPRPCRAEPVYSFPPPPPLWDRPQDVGRWIDGHEFTTREPPSSRVGQQVHPAYRQQAQDETASVYDVVGDKLSEIISLIDEEVYVGSPPELIITVPSPAYSPQELTATPATADSEKTLVNFVGPQSRYQSKSATYQQSVRQDRTVNWLAKVSFYANSRLPPSLPPLRVYIPTWPLFCLAAQYSSTAYSTPGSADWTDRSSCYIPSNPSTGTKAMVIKSVPCDSKKTIVFAIRGTSVLSLRDWNTNLNTKPTSPVGFLDDAGNLCHAGFLRVAKAMIQPIAQRLRQLLQQNPSRSECSLLITGHSAGGAVAALIFTHMLSQSVISDLTILTSCFKRVHCVTFGAPPVSLLPLSKPVTNQQKQQKFLFYSFINEGDPVVRAERSYIRSLVDLVTTQLPNNVQSNHNSNNNTGMRAMEMMTTGLAKLDLSILSSAAMGKKPAFTNTSTNTNRSGTNTTITSSTTTTNSYSPPQHLQSLNHLIPVISEDEARLKRQFYNNTHDHSTLEAVHPSHHPNHPSMGPTWTLPPSTLSNAGRLIVLRIDPTPSMSSSPANSAAAAASLKHEFETVRAEIVGDNQLRTVVFGDPMMHAMEVYRRRVEGLAMKAVTGRALDP